MNRPTTAREALIVEALGDCKAVLDRAESVTLRMDKSRKVLEEANAALGQRVLAFEERMAMIMQVAQTTAVQHVARRTNEMTQASITVQTRAMTEAARTLFVNEVGPTLQGLTASLRGLVERLDRRWESWWTHVATAAVSAAIAAGAAIYLLRV